ncbi:hypothetical protein GCM10029964_082810 [Kibdelosporangium lantanae]
MIRVLLADDQALIRAGFRALLEHTDDIIVVGRPLTANKPSAWPRPPGPTSS